MLTGLRTRAARTVRILDPRILRALVRSRVLDARGAVGAAAALPWLAGRGPSIGILTQINAVAFGSKPAIHDHRGSVSWRGLDRRANRLAGVLRGYGLQGDDRVATLLRNGREIVETIAACQKLGLDAAPLNTWAKPRELGQALERIRPVVLIYDVLHSELAGRAEPRPHLFFTGDPSRAVPGSASYEDLLARLPGGPPAPVAIPRRSPKVVIHTSGTSGRARAAARSSRTTGVGSLLTFLAVVPLRRDDVVLCPAPLFHSFGLLTLTIATALGATLVLPERFDPEGSLELIERHRVTAASFVPVMIRRILSLPGRAKERRDLSSLRIVLASGSAMSEDLRRAAMDLFGPVLYDLYGSTEAGWVAIAGPEDMRRDIATLGPAVPGVEVAVFSEDGDRLGPGEHGTVHVRSDEVFEGYESGEPVQRREGFLSIGDVGWLDSRGRLFVEGRADDMVVIGGENVYPAEVEEVIESLDGVREVAVVGVGDEEYGEVLAAFVAGSVDPDRVRDACRKELASFKVPRRIEVVDELPRTATGKVLKRELAAGPS